MAFGENNIICVLNCVPDKNERRESAYFLSILGDGILRAPSVAFLKGLAEYG